MPDPTDDREETTTEDGKPTITIAERDGETSESDDAKPTITIAEKDGSR